MQEQIDAAVRAWEALIRENKATAEAARGLARRFDIRACALSYNERM